MRGDETRLMQQLKETCDATEDSKCLGQHPSQHPSFGRHGAADFAYFGSDQRDSVSMGVRRFS